MTALRLCLLVLVLAAGVELVRAAGRLADEVEATRRSLATEAESGRRLERQIQRTRHPGE